MEQDTHLVSMDKCFEEVQNSNMSKLDDNGKPIYNDSGKVMKVQIILNQIFPSLFIKFKF